MTEMYTMDDQMSSFCWNFGDVVPREQSAVPIAGAAETGPATKAVPAPPDKGDRKTSFAPATRVGNANCPAGRPTSFPPVTTLASPAAYYPKIKHPHPQSQSLTILAITRKELNSKAPND